VIDLTNICAICIDFFDFSLEALLALKKCSNQLS